MNIYFENKFGLWKNIKITINSNVVYEAVKEKLTKINKNIFDKNSIEEKKLFNIINKYGNSILKEVLDDLMKRYFFNFINKKKINPLGIINYKPNKYKMGDNFIYNVHFEIYPKIDLFIDKLKINKPSLLIKKEDIDLAIKKIREKQSYWLESFDPICKMDRITIKFNTFKIGENLNSNKENELTFIVGKNIMNFNFENIFIGHKVGEQFSVRLFFSQNNDKTKLKVKSFYFFITIKKIEKLMLPKINVDFIKKNFLISNPMVTDLKDIVCSHMKKELKNIVFNRVKKELIDILINLNKIEIPEFLFKNEVIILKKKLISFQKNIMMSELPDELFAELAQYRIKSNLIIMELIHYYKIKLDDSYINKLLIKIELKNSKTKKIINFAKKNIKMLNLINNIILEEKAIEKLLNSLS